MATRVLAKNLEFYWVAIPVDLVILHWYTCGAEGRSGSLTYGALLLALRARESSAINSVDKYCKR